MTNEVKKHINILEYHQTGEIRKKYQELERKYTI